MQVAKQCVVSFHYTLTNDRGEILDSSDGRDPLAYLHGSGNIIKGLETGLEGRSVGEKLEVKVAPADGYGERDERLVQQVPRSAFQGVDKVEPGMRFQAQGPQGSTAVVITEVKEDTVTVDGNHALAGENLNFKVEITDVRDATAEELEHGHVHGPGGHQH